VPSSGRRRRRSPAGERRSSNIPRRHERSRPAATSVEVVPASSPETEAAATTGVEALPASSPETEVTAAAPTPEQVSDSSLYAELRCEKQAELEPLADDPELQFAVSFLYHSFQSSSVEIRLMCHLSNGDSGRDMMLCVGVDGVHVIAGELPAEPAPTCTVSCDRAILMQIIRGELEATNAIVCGMVMVDDLAQLMGFKMAFKLEREVFEAYLAAGPH